MPEQTASVWPARPGPFGLLVAYGGTRVSPVPRWWDENPVTSSERHPISSRGTRAPRASAPHPSLLRGPQPGIQKLWNETHESRTRTTHAPSPRGCPTCRHPPHIPQKISHAVSRLCPTQGPSRGRLRRPPSPGRARCLSSSTRRPWLHLPRPPPPGLSGLLDLTTPRPPPTLPTGSPRPVWGPLTPLLLWWLSSPFPKRLCH